MWSSVIYKAAADFRNHFVSADPKYQAALMLQAEWVATARPKQLLWYPATSDEWRVCFVRAGRGFGKTRMGAEMAAAALVNFPGYRLALVARTWSDAVGTCYAGTSGLKRALPPNSHTFNSSSGEGELWNGSQFKCFSAVAADSLRGKEFHGAWCDEVPHWRYLESLSNLDFCVRLEKLPGSDIKLPPKIWAMGTPRPNDLARSIIESAGTEVIGGSVFENEKHLPKSSLNSWQQRYEGTALYRQEMLGELLDEMPGALWTYKMINDNRISLRKDDPKPEDTIGTPLLPPLDKIIIGVDPQGKHKSAGGGSKYDELEDFTETGIVVVGRSERGHYYVLEDASINGKPHEWAARIAAAFQENRVADYGGYIYAEDNFGGDMVREVLNQFAPGLPLVTAPSVEGKTPRAEPVSFEYNKGKVHHVGFFSNLEQQMTSYRTDRPPEKSPDRMDALVFAVRALMPEIGMGNIGGFMLGDERRAR